MESDEVGNDKENEIFAEEMYYHICELCRNILVLYRFVAGL